MPSAGVSTRFKLTPSHRMNKVDAATAAAAATAAVAAAAAASPANHDKCLFVAHKRIVQISILSTLCFFIR